MQLGTFKRYSLKINDLAFSKYQLSILRDYKCRFNGLFDIAETRRSEKLYLNIGFSLRIIGIVASKPIFITCEL